MIAAVRKRFETPKDQKKTDGANASVDKTRPGPRPAPFSGSYSQQDQDELSKADSEAFRMAGVGHEARDDLRKRVVGGQ